MLGATVNVAMRRQRGSMTCLPRRRSWAEFLALCLWSEKRRNQNQHCEKPMKVACSPYRASVGSPGLRCWDFLIPSSSMRALSTSGEVLSAFFQSVNSSRYAVSLSAIFPIIR